MEILLIIMFAIFVLLGGGVLQDGVRDQRCKNGVPTVIEGKVYDCKLREEKK